MSVFRISDLSFDIINAGLKGRIMNEHIFWALSIQAQYTGRFRGEEWRPRAYCEKLPQISEENVTRWTDILDRTIEWKNNVDEETGAPIASLCIFEHLDIYDSKLTFGKREDYNSFDIDWQAKCDVFFDNDYGKDLDLVIQTRVVFEGVEVPFQEEGESEVLFRKCIPEGEFSFLAGDGRSYRSRYIPREASQRLST
jgi:hypothetical protein